VDGSALTGGAGDGAGAGVVLAGAGPAVAGGVVAELGQDAGGEDGSEAGLAEVDRGGGVAGEQRLDLGVQGGDLGAQRVQDRRLGADHGGVGGDHRGGLAQVRGAQRHSDRGRLGLDVAVVCPAQGGGDLTGGEPGRGGGVGGLGEQLEGVGGGEVLEGFEGGGEEVPQRVPQPQHVPGPFPDQRLVGAGHDLDRGGGVGVPGDGAQLVAVGADHVGQGVKCRPRRTWPRRWSAVPGSGRPAAG
jgi:hypothetical protein